MAVLENMVISVCLSMNFRMKDSMMAVAAPTQCNSQREYQRTASQRTKDMARGKSRKVNIHVPAKAAKWRSSSSSKKIPLMTSGDCQFKRGLLCGAWTAYRAREQGHTRSMIDHAYR
jgi:hypothetical protein